MKCYDNDYEWHKKDVIDKCFMCGEKSEGLFVVRHFASMKMVHLCPDCMVDRMSEYCLDNTRAWKGNMIKGD